jgi:hypothetical protein
MNARKPLDEKGVEPLAARIRDLPRAERSELRPPHLDVDRAAAALAFMALLVSGVLNSKVFHQGQGIMCKPQADAER